MNLYWPRKGDEWGNRQKERQRGKKQRERMKRRRAETIAEV